MRLVVLWCYFILEISMKNSPVAVYPISLSFIFKQAKIGCRNKQKQAHPSSSPMFTETITVAYYCNIFRAIL